MSKVLVKETEPLLDITKLDTEKYVTQREQDIVEYAKVIRRYHATEFDNTLCPEQAEKWAVLVLEYNASPTYTSALEKALRPVLELNVPESLLAY